MSDENKALTIPPVEALKAQLELRREQRLAAKISAYPRKNLILSDLGDCDRQMAYGVTEWKVKKLPSTQLMARFEVGHLMEREMTRELLGMGFDFVGSQDAVTVHGKGGVLLATGRIDGFVVWEKERIPVEFKSMNPNLYDQIDTIEDFQKKPWLRKYVRQLMMYCFGHSKEYGLFGLTNCLGGIKWFVLYLDLGECELLLQRMEHVVASIASGTLPERIKYREDVCGRCDFAFVCLPDVFRTEAEVLNDVDLIADLDKRESLRAASSEYERVDKSVKKRLKGIRKGIAGDYFINGEIRKRSGFIVKDSEYWQTSIQKVGEAK